MPEVWPCELRILKGFFLGVVACLILTPVGIYTCLWVVFFVISKTSVVLFTHGSILHQVQIISYIDGLPFLLLLFRKFSSFPAILVKIVFFKRKVVSQACMQKTPYFLINIWGKAEHITTLGGYNGQWQADLREWGHTSP